jgi:hypothetical protein
MKITLLATLVLVSVLGVSFAFVTSNAYAAASSEACWGQATRVFAQSGEMGEHASQQDNPRLGLRNLARALFDAGVIPEDTMQALGAFVADTLGLSIDACQ